MDLKDKVAIVTGSTRGIGVETAKMFAREGAKVVVTGRTGELCVRVAGEITAEGGTAVPLPADMGKESEVEALIRFAVETFGTLDILVNNHAPVAEMVDQGRDRPLAEAQSSDWDYILHAGLTSFYYSIKHALPIMMKNGGGSIVNISAGAAIRGAPGLSIYTAAKGGINAMTRQVAVDYGKHNIRVNTIVVGTIISNERIRTAWSHTKLREETIKGLCVTRLGKSEDVAYAAVYLASDKAGYVTGTEIVVDGGQSIKLPIPSLEEGWEISAAATGN